MGTFTMLFRMVKGLYHAIFFSFLLIFFRPWPKNDLILLDYRSLFIGEHRTSHRHGTRSSMGPCGRGAVGGRLTLANDKGAVNCRRVSNRPGLSKY